MKTDDNLWTKLRPKMDADTDATFRDAESGAIARVSPRIYSQDDVVAATAAFKVMREVDPASVAGLDALPAGTFWPGYFQ